MKKLHIQKIKIFNIILLFFLMIINFACDYKNKPSNTFKIGIEEFNVNQNVEAQFLIRIANLSKKIIAANDIAISKSNNEEIKKLSIEVKNEQQSLLDDITKLANNNLIIITELNSNNITKSKNTLIIRHENNFDDYYVDYLFFVINQEVEIFEEIILETKDAEIKKIVDSAIPKYQKFLQQLYNFKNGSIYKQL